MAVNKIIFNGSTLIDLTSITVSQSDVLSGKTFVDKSGNTLTGNVSVQYYHVMDTEPSASSIPDGDFVFIRG